MKNKLKKIVKIMARDPHPARRLIGIGLKKCPVDIGRIIPIKIKIDDYYIRLHGSAMSVESWCNPKAGQKDKIFISSFLRPRDHYIDIGANIGTTLIPGAIAVGNMGKVLGFEPHPKIFSYLKENIKLNNLTNVRVFNCALGNRKGLVHFSDQYNDDTNRILRKGEGLKVPMKLLDEFCEEFTRISLLKIDVEGYEKFVIEGGLKTLKRTDCVYIEISKDHSSHYEYKLQDIFVLLESSGFKLYIQTADHSVSPIPNSYYPYKRTENSWAIRNIETFLERTHWAIYPLKPHLSL